MQTHKQAHTACKASHVLCHWCQRHLSGVSSIYMFCHFAIKDTMSPTGEYERPAQNRSWILQTQEILKGCSMCAHLQASHHLHLQLINNHKPQKLCFRDSVNHLEQRSHVLIVDGLAHNQQVSATLCCIGNIWHASGPLLDFGFFDVDFQRLACC